MKTVHRGEWVKVRNLMSVKFRAGRPCSICRVAKCTLIWYSIRTSEVRCLDCFNPEIENTRGEVKFSR